MEKVDIAKILLDCPEVAGMELDCTIYEGVTFIRVDIRDYEFYPIKLKTRSGLELTLTKYGQYARHEDAKCVVFPKGKTSWEDFVTCKFKDGDICYVKTEHSESIFIFEDLNEFNFIKRYVSLRNDTLSADDGTVCQITSAKEFRFATEEEKKKLFDAIEANGYKWDGETKTLNKEFKDGDIIIRGRYIAIFWYIKPNGLIYYHCWYDTKYKDVRLEKDFGIGNINDKPMTRLATEEEKKKLFDAIEAKGYKWNSETKTLDKLNKFDVTTLKPFDKVLGRTNDNGIWECDLFSYYNGDELFNKFHCIGVNYKYCIPYEGNEKLLGTTNDCDDYFKTWEE